MNFDEPRREIGDIPFRMDSFEPGGDPQAPNSAPYEGWKCLYFDWVSGVLDYRLKGVVINIEGYLLTIETVVFGH